MGKRPILIGVLVTVLIAVWCARSGLAGRASKAPRPATLHEQEHCMDIWAQSNMHWDGWQVQVQMLEGRCDLTVGNRSQNGVFECWETRWSAIQCASHGGS